MRGWGGDYTTMDLWGEACHAAAPPPAGSGKAGNSSWWPIQQGSQGRPLLLLGGGGREQVRVQGTQVAVQHTIKQYVSSVLSMGTVALSCTMLTKSRC